MFAGRGISGKEVKPLIRIAMGWFTYTLVLTARIIDLGG